MPAARPKEAQSADITVPRA